MICNECETVAHCTSHGCIPKTTKQTEAMKLALEALEGSTDKTLSIRAMKALREALAEQPAQQKPVACANGCRGFVKHSPPAQRTWVGLTDEEVKNLWFSVGAEPIEVRLIEAKLKEKNT